MSRISVFGVPGLPEIEPGDDLAAMIVDAIAGYGRERADNDILVVTHKVVS